MSISTGYFFYSLQSLYEVGVQVSCFTAQRLTGLPRVKRGGGRRGYGLEPNRLALVPELLP